MEKEQNIKIRVYKLTSVEITNHFKVETKASAGPCAQRKVTGSWHLSDRHYQKPYRMKLAKENCYLRGVSISE